MSYFATCSHCDYHEEYNPCETIYHYIGLSKNNKYPSVHNAWCNDCKKFVPVQMGINIKLLQAKLNTLEYELKRKNGKLIKLSKTKLAIKELEKNIAQLSELKSILGNDSTITSCIECNGTNIVFKDISTQVWLCPKCRKGYLILKEEKDDILIRLGETYIKPIKFDGDISKLVDKFIMCSIDILNNTGLYYSSLKDQNLIKVLTRATSMIDRLSLIFAYLKCVQKKNIPKESLILSLTENLIETGVIKNDVKNHVIYRFDKRIEYFINEIDIEMNCSAVIPTALIDTLRHPQDPPTTKITGVNPIDAINEWKIITDTIKAYFNHDFKRL